MNWKKASLGILLLLSVVTANADLLEGLEKIGYHNVVNSAAKNGSLAFGQEFKSSFESRFKLSLPSAYREVAEQCYFRELSWPKHKGTLARLYGSRFTESELTTILGFYAKEAESQGRSPGLLGLGQRLSVRKELAEHILDVKKMCFGEAKQAVRPYLVQQQSKKQ